MDDADAAARQKAHEQPLEAETACRHLGPGGAGTACVGMDRSQLGEQRRQSPFHCGGGQRRDVGARSLDFRDDTAASRQLGPAERTPDVEA